MECPKLQRRHQGVRGPVVLAVMDGVGEGRGDAGDAVAQAHTPNLDRYSRDALGTSLKAHGTAVGLPTDADMGNSEVGHNAMGAGRVYEQGAKRVNHAIRGGSMFAEPVWQEMVRQCREQATPLHFIGLLSDGNVHSHIDHLIAMVRQADREGVEQVYIHALLDGRDVPKTSALEYIDQLEGVLAPIDAKADRRYRIASGGGRMTITMDRYESDWGMVERGWHVHVLGRGRGFASAREAVETMRAESPGVTDQELDGFVITENGEPVGPIHDGASVILFNFRGDRMLELTRAFEDDDFEAFDRVRRPHINFAGMTLYDGETSRPKTFLVPPPVIECTLGELLANAGVSQFACSETQKFGHVTYFFNGNRTGCFNAELERYVEVPSWPPPFDARPEMKANEIAAKAIDAVASGEYGFIRINFANGDMVGHTGNFEATVRAVEATDAALGKLEAATLEAGGALVVTADHGNAEEMAERDKKSGALKRDATGQLVPKTSHTLNPVLLRVLLPAQQAASYALADVQQPGLANLAATICSLLGFEPPSIYEPSLLQRTETS